MSVLGLNSFSVGSDTTLNIISNGVIVAATILTSFEARQEATLAKSKGIDGINRNRYLEEGWEGTLEFDRADSTIDDYFAAKEAARYNGQQPPEVALVQTDTNPDGTIVKYAYVGVTMKYDSIGARKGDAKVDQKVTWNASFREKRL